ncbi:type III pantothenate kinase [Thermosipho globiformans]|uniref:type III pantothenate kinase n=1 Tax=Thermosipho globiformans TaxID=380685 RepID=UPI000F8E1E94|nr:type III pantothenate kinase [Thermosipho globiformans]
MLLLFDVGNTHTTIALTKDGKSFDIKRVSTHSIQTEDELYVFLKMFYKNDFKDIVVSSVVPNINYIFEFFSEKYLNKKAIFVSAKEYNKIAWNVNTPEEIGADRVVDVIAASRDYGKDAIVVDFGTAITIEVLKDNRYEGGVIIPGFNMMVNALFKGTAKLPKVELKPSNTFVGKDTESNIRIGVINTILGGIDYTIGKIKSDYDLENVPIIYTGGQSKLIKEYLKKDIVYDIELGLRGIYYFYENTAC